MQLGAWEQTFRHTPNVPCKYISVVLWPLMILTLAPDDPYLSP
jgi:hypothetical protein